jgi:hypothetical protein
MLPVVSSVRNTAPSPGRTVMPFGRASTATRCGAAAASFDAQAVSCVTASAASTQARRALTRKRTAVRNDDIMILLETAASFTKPSP